VQLSQTNEAKLGEQEEQTGTRTDELERSLEALTCEATELRVQLDAMTVEHVDEKREVTQAMSQAETVEECAKHLEEELDRLRRGSGGCGGWSW
jgi:predicted RNase H-like nuclease (RuvC/YqgF family)